MAHDDTQRGNRPDRSHINVNDAVGLRHWAQRFHASEDDVKDAMAQVGDDVGDVGDVGDFLQSGRKPHRHPGEHRPPRL